MSENEGTTESSVPEPTIEQIVDAVTAKLAPQTQANSAAVLAVDGPEPKNAANTQSTNVHVQVVGERPKSLGRHFVDSEQFATLQKAMTAGIRPTNWSSGKVEIATLLSEDSGSGGDLLVPQYQPGILPVMFRRLTVADLMPNGTTTSPSITYFEETTATNAAAATSEGSAKAESALVFNAVTESVRKIATILPVTDEMLEDVSVIRSYIDGRLRLFVALTEESQLLTGNGDAPNLSGILDRSGVQTTANSASGTFPKARAVYAGITKVRTGETGSVGLEPDGLVVHPNDWQDLRLEQDGNGQFAGGGPMTGQYGVNGVATGEMYWGLRVVVTPAITEGTALVGAFSTAAQVFRRSGITVEATNSHDDWFAYNKTAIRAESRLALAVYRPKAFCTVTGL